MPIIIAHLGLLIIGMFFLVIGIRFIFDKRYAEKMKYKSDKYVDERTTYIYGRYVRGASCVIFGLMFVLYSTSVLIRLLGVN